MSHADVLSCSFSSWYSSFKGKTIKSVVIPLSEDFLKDLLADRIILPDGWTMRGDAEEEEHDEILEEDRRPAFTSIREKIEEAIKRLGGAVFPKLNWSSPKDATWMQSGGSLRCDSPADIYLLLKSSDFITHDLGEPFERCTCGNTCPLVKYDLVLRRWENINPSTEFRCFVSNGQLVAICQRHTSDYYEHLKKDEEAITEDVLSFYESVVKEKFPLNKYCFDVYRKYRGKVVLLDFGPWGEVSDSALVSYEELEKLAELESQLPVFKRVENSGSVSRHPYSAYALPLDVAAVSTGDTAAMVDLMRAHFSQMGGKDDATGDES